MHGLWRDLVFGVRSLSKRPGLSLLAIAVLAVGMGASTSVFSAVNAALLRPLPYPGAERLVYLWEQSTEDGRTSGVSGAMFSQWRDGATAFDSMAAFRANQFNLSTADGPERVRGAVVSPGFFETLQLPARLGRATLRDGNGGRAVVLGEELWRRRFSADPRIIGQTLNLNGELVTVSAVMPADFATPQRTELWLGAKGELPEHPLRPQSDTRHDREAHYLGVIARLKAGESRESASAQLSTLATAVWAGEAKAPWAGTAVSMREEQVGPVRPMLLVLFGAVAFMLLIACANVANLLLTRALDRQHEVAVRLALGATRGGLVRLFLSESLLLALAATSLGLLLAQWAAPALVALSPSSLRIDAIELDVRVVGFAVALALLTGSIFGLLPLSVDASPGEALQETARSGGARQGKLRSALIILEVALSVVLLAGAGLMARSFFAVAGMDAGLKPEKVLTAELSLPPSKYPGREEQVAFFSTLLARLRALPEVERAAAISRLPLSGGNSGRSVELLGKPGTSVQAGLRVTTPDYFEALGIPILQGRGLAETDTAQSPGVVVVSAAFAKAAWPGESALGKRVSVQLDHKESEVVGVAGDVRHDGLDEEPRPEIYVSYQAEAWPFMTLALRSRAAPETLAGALRTEVQALDRELPLAKVMPMEERIDGSLASRRFSVSLLSAMALLAVLLAVTGLYGVMSFIVTQRRQELGIRLALGARPSALVQMVLRQGMGLVGVGVGVGLCFALGLGQLLRGFLFHVSATDPLTLAGVGGAIALAAALATWLAARRATRVDPMVALKGEG